jgi:hypothetical protein
VLKSKQILGVSRAIFTPEIMPVEGTQVEIKRDAPFSSTFQLILCSKTFQVLSNPI